MVQLVVHNQARLNGRGCTTLTIAGEGRGGSTAAAIGRVLEQAARMGRPDKLGGEAQAVVLAADNGEHNLGLLSHLILGMVAGKWLREELEQGRGRRLRIWTINSERGKHIALAIRRGSERLRKEQQVTARYELPKKETRK